MEYAASPDGTRVAYHTDAPGDPIYLADANGSHARRLCAAGPGGHCHYLSWSPDARYIYFVKGVPTTQEMDIWRVRTTGAAAPERITDHNARVGYPGSSPVCRPYQERSSKVMQACRKDTKCGQVHKNLRDQLLNL